MISDDILYSYDIILTTVYMYCAIAPLKYIVRATILIGNLQ